MQRKENLVKTIVFLIILCFIFFTSHSFSSVKKQKELTPTQKWALATGAILTEIWDASHDILGGAPPDATTRKEYSKLLDEWWDIHDRRSALEILDWLINEGHRKEYEKYVSLVSRMSDTEYKKLLQRYAGDEKALNRITFARKYHKNLGNKSLIAWDFCRYVNVSGWCYVCGYITEGEAWARIIPAAKTIQKTYSSWDDMANGYLIGLLYWSGKRHEDCADIVKALLNDPNSPWRKYSWTMKLTK